MVLASCGNKYYRTNFIYAVPSSLLIAPGLRTIRFLFRSAFLVYKKNRWAAEAEAKAARKRKAFDPCMRIFLKLK
jgi:hypothetical protein